MVKALAKAVHHNSDTVEFVNATSVSESTWKHIID